MVIVMRLFQYESAASEACNSTRESAQIASSVALPSVGRTPNGSGWSPSTLSTMTLGGQGRSRSKALINATCPSAIANGTRYGRR